MKPMHFFILFLCAQFGALTADAERTNCCEYSARYDTINAMPGQPIGAVGHQCTICPYGFSLMVETREECDSFCDAYVPIETNCPMVGIYPMNRANLASGDFCTRERESVALFNYLCQFIRTCESSREKIDQVLQDAIEKELPPNNGDPEVLRRLERIRDDLSQCPLVPPKVLGSPCAGKGLPPARGIP